jgi:hypothetical protein
MMIREKWSSADAAVLLGSLQTWLLDVEATKQQQVFVKELGKRLGVESAGPVELNRLKSLTPDQQKTALRTLVSLSCFRPQVSDTDLARLKELEKVLKPASVWPSVLSNGKKGRNKLVTMSIARCSPDAVSIMKQVRQKSGIFGVMKAMSSTFMKASYQPEMAKRYLALGDLPKDTLGYAFFHHMKSRNLGLPGEAGGVPEFGLQHDLTHVVTGFDTDARGESRLGGFYFGAVSRHPIEGADPFALIMVILMTFQLGYRIGPSFVAAEVGQVDPAEVLGCVDVGTRVPFNFLTDWNMQEDLYKPIAEVRAKFGMHRDGGMASITGTS